MSKYLTRPVLHRTFTDLAQLLRVADVSLYLYLMACRQLKPLEVGGLVGGLMGGLVGGVDGSCKCNVSNVLKAFSGNRKFMHIDYHDHCRSIRSSLQHLVTIDFVALISHLISQHKHTAHTYTQMMADSFSPSTLTLRVTFLALWSEQTATKQTGDLPKGDSGLQEWGAWKGVCVCVC